MKPAFNRILATALVLLGVCTTTFLLLRLTPGDPVELMLKDHASPAEAQSLREELGLEKPFIIQYFIFLKNIAHGDLGVSYVTRLPVTTEIKNHLLPTFILAVSAMLFALTLGIPLGVLSAVHVHSFFDKFVAGFSLLGLSLPSFWIAPVFIIIFSIKLNILPVSGQEEGALSLILPSVTLGLSLAAVLIRITRAATLEVMNQEYITVARAKGLTEKVIFFKHALRNALNPIITVAGLQFGAVATGVVITETIFDWPGLGILLFSGLRERNYPIVQGCILCIGVLYVLVNLLTDLAYGWVNPQGREQ
jgi:peptide/nickel transport system permease protein